MNHEPAVARAYKKIIGLYPRSFRDEYRGDMVQLFRDQCDDEPAWRVCGRAVVDLAISIPVQQLEARMNRTPNYFVPLLYAAVAAGAVLFAVVNGTNLAGFFVSLCVAVIAGTLSTLAWRRTGPISNGFLIGAWWKVLVAGLGILALVIGITTVTRELDNPAWSLMIMALLMSLLLIGFGLVLGLARLLGRRSRVIPG